MININLIRENPKLVKENQKKRGFPEEDIDNLVELDRNWRALKDEVDKLRNRRNKISEEINHAKKQKKDASKLLDEAKEIPKLLEEKENKLRELETKRNSIHAIIPNIQHESAPVGDEKNNKEIKRWGEIPKFNFKIKSHVELLEALDLLDMKRAAKIAGSGFYLLKGQLAKLERALIQFMLDYHINNNFLEINPPQLVNKETMFGTGNLPKFELDIYKTQENLYLIPTAEVSLTNLHANECLDEAKLPKKYVAFTQCYRTEAGKHGSETPGIFRLHQFEKVEIVYICKPQDSFEFLEEMTKHAEKLLEMLKLPYQRVLLATGDASFASAKTYDLGVWSPSLNKYLETSSCSNCTDFQARRMSTKYLERESNERKLVHTLNGSGLATPRLLISLIENNQTADGSIKIPPCLWKYTGFKIIRKAKK